MFNSRFKSLKDLQDAFPTEQHCIDYLEERRWGVKVVSLLILLPKSANAKIINIVVKTLENTLMLRLNLFFIKPPYL